MTPLDGSIVTIAIPSMAEFVQGMRNFFLVTSAIGVVATLTSLVRGQENRNSNARDQV
jgi:hypothetical protein